MSPEDMVDAALVGLEQGELVTIPSLHEGGEWIRFEAARRAISKQFGNSKPASRYRLVLIRWHSPRAVSNDGENHEDTDRRSCGFG